MDLQLAPSILDADFSQLKPTLDILANEGVHWLHLDVMDGHFVPNLTFGPPVASHLIKACRIPAEAHLMVTNPMDLVEGFAAAGCRRLIVHPEGQVHVNRLLSLIEGHGMESGLVINPTTPVCAIRHELHRVALVLVMTVNPGFGGQAFIDQALSKVEELAHIRSRESASFRIEVDGGVNEETLERCVRAGADTFVIGSAIFRSPDPALALRNFTSRLTTLGKVGTT